MAKYTSGLPDLPTRPANSKGKWLETSAYLGEVWSQLMWAWTAALPAMINRIAADINTLIG